MEMEKLLNDVEKVKILDLKETDILVFMMEGKASDFFLQTIKRAVKEKLGINNKVMVLEEGMDIKVLREGEWI